MALKAALTTFLQDLKNILASSAQDPGLIHEISILQNRLDEPLRVAVVGVIKTGKSTLMNALLKSSLVSTGNLETTYNVCWFKYGPEPMFNVVFNDRSSESFPMEQLEHWTIRQRTAENQRIKQVKYIEVHLPVDELKSLELIDTPGLNSIYKTDSDNTFGILGMDRSSKLNHEQATIYEASIADAVIYAFNKPASITDQQFLQRFQGDHRNISSPINAVGVLTQVDLTETGDDLGAIMTSARKRVRSKMKDRSVSSLLYSILPVVAKPMEGVLDLSIQEWDWLEALATIDRNELWEDLDNINKFIERPSAEVHVIMAGEADRNALALKLTAHGIDTITSLFRRGHTQPAIYDLLYETCGMSDLRDVLIAHFGSRNLLIKSKYIFTRLHTLFAVTPDHQPVIAKLYRGITDRIWEMENNFQVFKELKVLQDHYNGLLGFSGDELESLLRLFGEHGPGCEQRLGLDTPAYISDMLAVAKSQAMVWRKKQHRAGLLRQQTNAIRTAISSYDSIIDLLSRLTGD
ncbi:dynamin family protein [Emticicia fontis]